MKIFQKFLLIPSWYIFGEFLVRFSEFLPFDPYRGGGLADPQIGLDLGVFVFFWGFWGWIFYAILIKTSGKEFFWRFHV